MASSQSPNRVYFTNFDRSVNDTNTDFTITFDTPIQNAYNFEVVSASFPNLFKPFSSYETIFYFYHQSFDSGQTAIAIPMSTTQVGGTGEASPPAGRDTYIDKRYFADGTDLAAYITAWLQSLSVSWPTQASGLRPFYYAGDDPRQAPTYFANAAATGVTFSNLSMAFDDLTSNGTLKMTFADSGSLVVRVASILDFGSLTAGFKFPSQMGFKLGYTAFQYEAFSSGIVSVTPSNNQFVVGGQQGGHIFTIPPNDYSIAGLVAQLNTLAAGIPPSIGVSVVFSESGGVLTATFAAGTYTLPGPQGIANGGSALTLLGFTQAASLLVVAKTGGAVVAASAIVTNSQAPSPAFHVAPDTINLIRTASVYIASSLSSGESLASAGRKDILFVVPLTAGIGDVQLYQSSLSGIVINRPPSSIRNLRITFLDDNFQIMEPLPQNAPISVEIHFAYNEDAKANQLDFKSTNIYS